MDENTDFRVEANKSMKVILENEKEGDEIINKKSKAPNTQINEEEDLD